MKLAHLPLRVATGAYILNSGVSKQNLEGEAAEGVHGMAVNAIPALKKIPAGAVRTHPVHRRNRARCGTAGPIRAFGSGRSRIGGILRWAGSAVPEDARHAATGQHQAHSGRHRPREGCMAARCWIDLAP